jgi:hypothetical protein
LSIPAPWVGEAMKIGVAEGNGWPTVSGIQQSAVIPSERSEERNLAVSLEACVLRTARFLAGARNDSM